MKATFLSATLIGLLCTVSPAQAQKVTTSPAAPKTFLSPAEFDLARPDCVVQAFLTAYSRGDSAAMADYVEGATTTSATSNAIGLSRRKTQPSDFRILMTPLKVTFTAPDEAVLLYTVQDSMTDSISLSFSALAPDAILLRRAGNSWKIVPPTPEDVFDKNEEKPLSSNLVRCFAFLLRYPEKVAQVKVMEAGNAAVSDVEKITSGLVRLANDYEQVFQVDPTQYRTSLAPYVRDGDTYRSALDEPGTVSYRFNKKLANKSLNHLTTPSTTVLVYEGETGKPAFRYNGLAVIGFANGSVKLVTPEEAKKLHWTP